MLIRAKLNQGSSATVIKEQQLVVEPKRPGRFNFNLFTGRTGNKNIERPTTL
jgi:hypothetical protein